MKKRNILLGFPFIFAIACGAPHENQNFSELSSAKDELEKCYLQLPKKECKKIIQGFVTHRTACDDVKIAAELACFTQISTRKLETMSQIMGLKNACEEHYQSKIDQICGKFEANTRHEDHTGHDHNYAPDPVDGMHK